MGDGDGDGVDDSNDDDNNNDDDDDDDEWFLDVHANVALQAFEWVATTKYADILFI